jgi:radical SAM superfamily enzyme YgiQ (UPF0313 family)
MRRIQLIQSPYRFPDPTAHRSEPLGIEYLAASLRRAGHEVAFYDPTLGPPRRQADGLYHYGVPHEEMARRIKAFSPDVVGISCHYAFGANDAYTVADIAKQADDRMVTVMGGLFVSTHGEKPLRECSPLDYSLVGEADTSLPALLDLLSTHDGRDFETIDGLLWRDGDAIRHNEKTAYITDLDNLPFPARDLVDIRTYMEGSKFKRLYGLGFLPALSLLTSRSCPHRCSFCNMRLVHGNRWRPRSADNVLDELEEITGKYQARHVFIMDDNFTLDIGRAKIICEKIIRRSYPFRWNTPNGISVKGVDPELARLMKEAGCANICVAVESGSEYIRHAVMKKRTTDAEIIQAVDCFKNAGIPVVGFVLLGMPGENGYHFNKTMELLKRLPLTSIVVSFAIPFPGTQLYEDMVRDGLLRKGDTAGMDDLNAPSFETPDFTREELIRRKQILKDMFPGLAILHEIETGNPC